MVVRDVFELVKDDTGLFAFLPVVNAIYVLTQAYSDWWLVMTVVGVFASSVIYNIITGEPESVSTRVVWLLRITWLIWLVILVLSLNSLYILFDQSKHMPEILFFISILFLSLLITDFLMSMFLDGYESQL